MGYLAGHLVRDAKHGIRYPSFSVGAMFNSVRNSLSREAYLDVSSTTQGRVAVRKVLMPLSVSI